jgi:hypothetical protein
MKEQSLECTQNGFIGDHGICSDERPGTGGTSGFHPALQGIVEVEKLKDPRGVACLAYVIQVMRKK